MPNFKANREELLENTQTFTLLFTYIISICAYFIFSEEDSNLYCKLTEIRPRARNMIEIKDLKIGQKVMVNHNTEQQHEKGYWYV